MKAVLHYTSRYDKTPGGIWWHGPNEKIQSYYTDHYLEQTGLEHIRRLKPDVDIDQYFDYLDQRMPYGEVWIGVDIPEGVTPQEVLAAHTATG